MNIAAPCARAFVLILILSVIALTIPLASGRKSKSSQVTMAMRLSGSPLGARIWDIDKYGLTAELVLIPGSARGWPPCSPAASNSRRVRHRAAVGLFARRRRCGGGCRLEQVSFSVIARKEIRQPSDLIGKKIGIVNFGGSNDLAVTLAFKEWNIPRSAATILASGGAPERLAALMTATLDATVLSPPETVAASRAGLTILANLGDLSASFPQTLIMVRRSFLANKRETVKRFAHAPGEALSSSRPTREGIKVYANRLKQRDQTILDETLAFYGPKFSFPPRVDRGGINNALELVRRRTQGRHQPWAVCR